MRTHEVPLLKGHSHPLFTAHDCYEQTAGEINMPLSREVGLGPGDIVLDGDPVPPKGGTTPQLFALYLL